MKYIIIGFALIAAMAGACNSAATVNSEKKDTTANKQEEASSPKQADTSPSADIKVNEAMKEMVTQYLQIKNALANDNGRDAATAGNAFVESMDKMEKNSLSDDKKKVWNSLSDDAREMAEHIGKNGDKIEHQREHFDMLSQDMYDMVKAFGSGQLLYKDYCPMYNKGSIWLSEVKEIKNPYLGKKMPTCGSLKEEIKK